jgi:hypothetical protein
VNITSVVIHDEDLVALKPIAGSLKDQFLPIKGKVGFCVLPPKGELPYIGQVLLLRK